MTFETLQSHLWLAMASLCGVFMRAARWEKQDGTIDYKKAVFECMTAPGIGVITASIGAKYNIDPTILGGIAAALGLLGPAAIETLALKLFNQKIGGPQ